MAYSNKHALIGFIIIFVCFTETFVTELDHTSCEPRFCQVVGFYDLGKVEGRLSYLLPSSPWDAACHHPVSSSPLFTVFTDKAASFL